MLIVGTHSERSQSIVSEALEVAASGMIERCGAGSRAYWWPEVAAWSTRAPPAAASQRALMDQFDQLDADGICLLSLCLYHARVKSSVSQTVLVSGR